jgi:TRAP-type C4-dicarboxylate transport system permease small subunit
VSSPSSAPVRVKGFLQALDRLELAITNTALVVILVTICWNVVFRYVLKTPVSWAEDVTSIAFAWFIFIGMAAVHNRRGHIGIDLVTSLLPDGPRLFLEKGVDWFVMIVCAYTAYLCGRQTVISHYTAETTVLKIPLSVLFISLTIGFALMALRSACFALGMAAQSDKD